MGLYLRRAVEEDMDLLFTWANDDAVRNNAFHTEKIPYEEHVRWFAEMMADRSAYQYILCEAGMPAGQARLNVGNREAVIDYSICGQKRGKGYGSELLRLVCTQAGIDKIPGIDKITGLVKYENIASARAFERCGFTRKELAGHIRYELELQQTAEISALRCNLRLQKGDTE